MDSIPTLAIVTPEVPPRMMMKAGMFMNEAGEVPSIMALNRIATVATTIPMMVAAFMVPIRLIDRQRERSSGAGRLLTFAVGPNQRPGSWAGRRGIGAGSASRSE